MTAKDKKHKYAYVERDLSWMYFNRRILQEAARPEVPLLEWLSFLGIYSNNLDEFFRVRMATLGRIAECDDKSLHDERDTARRLIKQINKLNNRYAEEFSDTMKEVTARLREEHIFLLREDELDESQQAFVREFYYSRLGGFISPVWLSAVRQLADETDESIYLAVKMQAAGKKSSEFALIRLADGIIDSLYAGSD